MGEYHRVQSLLRTLLAAAVLAAFPSAALASNGGATPPEGDGVTPVSGGVTPGSLPLPAPPSLSPSPTPSPTPGPIATGSVALFGAIARAPEGAPPVIAAAVAAANRLRHKPYRFGGGHRSFSDSAYDCSGAVSYVLHGAGLLESPLDSTGFKHWGAPGEGAWITIYANKSHAFMVIGGMRFDTSGPGPSGPRWRALPRSLHGFVARHPAGL